MKKLFLLSLIILLFAGCRKDKLVGAYSILEGKWQWVGATETRTVLSNGNEAYFYHDASDYPDEYFMEFKRKGILSYLKNDVEELNYRVVINLFTDNCNTFSSCYVYGINFDNKKNVGIAGRVSDDSLTSSSSNTNLPLSKHSDNYYEYTYSHKFVKVN